MIRQSVCAACGRPKPPGRGRRLCDRCQDLRRPIWERQSALDKAARAKELRTHPQERKPRKGAPPGQRWCARCGQFLPIEDFPSPAGSYCQECSSMIHHEANISRNYNITSTEYEDLLLYQDGRCAICLKKPRIRRLAVDHNHKTDEVRGLLCTPNCNRWLIGGAFENPELLRRAADYLEDPPARRVLGKGKDSSPPMGT